MISVRNNRKLRVRSIIAFMLVVSLLFACCTVYFDFRLRSVAVSFAKSAAKTAVINCANRASNRALSEMDISYDTLARISRNAEGIATSVEIDSVAANRLKSKISDEIAKDMAEYEEIQFKVPLSAAFGMYFTSVKWPKLSYTVHITTTVKTNFKSEFKSAGINQVLHQILLTVDLESDLAMLEKRTEQVTQTEFIVAQTVIVGAVPDAFTSVGHATDEVMEDIFDFGAQAPN